MASFDWLVAPLVCPVCGAVSAADSSTNMQTYIQDQPSMTEIGVGDLVDLPRDDVADRGFIEVQRPGAGEAIHLLTTWECPTCGSPYLWAEVIVEHSRIVDIRAVSLDRERLERANYISPDCDSTVSELTGLDVSDLIGKDMIALLRQHLRN